MADIHPQDVLKALSAIEDPASHHDIVSLGWISDLEVGYERVTFTLQLPPAAAPAQRQMVAAAKGAVEALGVPNVQIRIVQQPGTAAGAAGHAPRPGSDLIPNVKSTVAGASGKGGGGQNPLTRETTGGAAPPGLARAGWRVRPTSDASATG